MKPYYSLWAKTSSKSEQWHPLVCHLSDTGHVALALWETCFSKATRQFYMDKLGLSAEETGRLLAFLVSLHDIGKVSPGFQRKWTAVIPILKKTGFNFLPEGMHPAHHGVMTAWILEKLLPVVCKEYSSIFIKRVARALGGHHGIWPTSNQFTSQALKRSDIGDQYWQDVRIEVISDCRSVFQPPDTFCWNLSPADENAFLTLLSGFVSFADWIGSMSEYFSCQQLNLSISEFELSDYALISRSTAQKALSELGWQNWQAKGSYFDFNELFPFEPNQMQKTVIQKGSTTDLPAMMIIEAPTGSGKTEAALYLAGLWLEKTQNQGCYIAMPTQATSNQMYTRVKDFLLKLYPHDKLNLHLVHGGQLKALTPGGITQILGENEHDPDQDKIQAESWFLPKKRTLLAPFGVGTVDQTFLSVLQTRHFFVRMFGLGQKVLIFDEVHAYDFYMSELFKELLAWLKGIGTSVILLSATLNQKAKNDLITAWGSEIKNQEPGTYPEMTIASSTTMKTISFPSTEHKKIILNQVADNHNDLTNVLTEKLKDGGSAAVLCNTVNKARQVYQALLDINVVCNDNLYLFHSRYPYYRRMEIENTILNLFSKGGKRPDRAIVVATQVIEQSLDLDFDYMISEIAPIDLLIQRLGRLHRHWINQIMRSSLLDKPIFTLIQPNSKNGIPEFGINKKIYDESILIRTWELLKNKTELILPDETASLVEAVYGKINDDNLSDAIREHLKKTDEQLQKKRHQDIFESRVRLIPNINIKDIIFKTNSNLEEDNPVIHHSLSALTRLGEQSIDLICLYQTEKGLAITPNGNAVIESPDIVPDSEQIQLLLQAKVSVQDIRIVRYFSNYPVLSAWKKLSALRHTYAVFFPESGTTTLNDSNLILKLDNTLGLIIEEEK